MCFDRMIPNGKWRALCHGSSLASATRVLVAVADEAAIYVEYPHCLVDQAILD